MSYSAPNLASALKQTGIPLSRAMAGERLAYLDNLKVFLILLVILYHTVKLFLWHSPEWPLSGGAPSPGVMLGQWAVSATGAFFISLFFLVSGYFVPASFSRKGERKYLLDRFVRLGIPVLAFTFLVFPLFFYAMQGLPGGLSIGGLIAQHPGLVWERGVGHLWFMAWLLIFGVVYALWKVASAYSGLSLKSLKIAMPGNLAILGFAAVLALADFIARAFYPLNVWTPMYFVEPGQLPGYVAMFCVGIIAYDNKWPDTLPAKKARLWGIVAALAILSYPVLRFVVFPSWDHTAWDGGLSGLSALQSAWDALVCTGLCVSLPALFRRRFDFQGKILKEMAGDVYAVYLIHILFVYAVYGVLQSVDMPAVLRFIAAAIIVILLAFGASSLIRKIPYMDRVL